VQAKGRAEVGGQLSLRMQPVVGSAVTLRPTVVEVIEGRRLRWLGRLLVRLLQRSLDRGTLPAFEAMNTALKDRAERATVARG
jgi:hypothetical protein